MMTEKWPGGCIPTLSGCILFVTFSLTFHVPAAKGRYLYMPLPSRGQSTVRVCVTNKSAGRMKHVPRGFKQPWTSNLVHACSCCRMVEYYASFLRQKNGLVIILEVLYDEEFIWLYGNMIFMVILCSPL